MTIGSAPSRPSTMTLASLIALAGMIGVLAVGGTRESHAARQPSSRRRGHRHLGEGGRVP